MHGRVKVKTSAEKELEKQKERAEKAKVFVSTKTKAFDKKNKNELDDELLDITASLLAHNPDYYTFWNIRREVILKKNKSNYDNNITFSTECDDPNLSVIQNLCENELQLTAICLKKNPKSYNAWHQRKWIINMMPKSDLNKELFLCNQFLEMDERNFHCWDYRRLVCNMANINVNEELSFTLEKIKQNFSNFSSWYYRSCLFTLASNKYNYDFTQQWNNEYDLVENALFTDPSDQSAWFYHKWLVSTNYGNNLKQTNETYLNNVNIEKIIYSAYHSQIIIHLTRPIKYQPFVMLNINENFLPELIWKSASGNYVSSVWYCDISSQYKLTKLSISPCPTFAVNPDTIEPIEVTTDENENYNFFVWKRKNSDKYIKYGLKDSQLNSLRSLNQIESNKWVKLSLAWLETNYLKKKEMYDQLKQIDPLRTNYYNDIRSKMQIENQIESEQTTTLSLKGLELTALYFADRMTSILYLDLSNNSIKKLTKNFNYLLSLEVLILDFNQVYTIEKEFCLNKLKLLSLNNNCIKNVDALNNLKNSCELKTLLIGENGITSALTDECLSQLSLPSQLQVIKSATKTPSIENMIQSYKQLNIIYKLY